MNDKELKEQKKSERAKEYHFFDRMMKKALHLSSECVVDFINGLYQKDYDRDHTVIRYLNTEFIQENMDERRADMILELNRTDKYHIEIQIGEDKSMTLRMMEYGYEEAKQHREEHPNKVVLRFAEPKVIFLQHTKTTPDRMTVELHFPKEKIITYDIETLKALKLNPQELARQRLYILVPFQVLRTRKIASANITSEQKEKLLKHYENTMKQCIISLKELHKEGVIPQKDYLELNYMLQEVNNYLYRDVKEIQEGRMMEMVAEEIISYADMVEARGYEQGMEQGYEQGIIVAAVKMIQKGHQYEETIETLGLKKDDIKRVDELLKEQRESAKETKQTVKQAKKTR